MNNLKRYIDMAVKREVRRFTDDEHQKLKSAVDKLISFLKAVKPKSSEQRGYINDAIFTLGLVLLIDKNNMSTFYQANERYERAVKMLEKGGLFDKSDSNDAKAENAVRAVTKALMDVMETYL